MEFNLSVHLEKIYAVQGLITALNQMVSHIDYVPNYSKEFNAVMTISECLECKIETITNELKIVV